MSKKKFRSPSEAPPAAAPATAQPSRLQFHGFPLLALAALALLAYSNSFGVPLIYDSEASILQDSRIWTATWESVREVLTSDYWYDDRSSGLYRPLTKLSFLFNYAILGNGPAPAGYHSINFGLHALNMWLAYLLGVLWLGDRPRAFAMAALWGLHPVMVESVTNVVGRADEMAAAGVLAGLLCHVKAASASGMRRAGWLTLLACSAAFGIFSKEGTIVLPGVLLLYDLLRREGPPWKARVAGYAAAALPIAIYLALRVHVQSTLIRIWVEKLPFLQNPIFGSDYSVSLPTAFQVIGRQVGLWLWPARLSCDYSYNAIPLFSWRFDQPFHWLAPMALAGSLAAAGLALAWRRRRPEAAFFIGLFFGALFPSSNLAIHIGSIMGERFLYLPSLGLAGCLTLGLFAAGDWLAARRPALQRSAPAALCAILLALAGRTWARNLDWADRYALWTSAVEAVPESYMAHLGAAMARAAAHPGDAEALREIDRSLAILEPVPDERNVAMAYAVGGALYRARGDSAPPAERERWLRRALEILQRGRRIDRAVDRVIRRHNAGRHIFHYSAWPEVYLELGRVHLRLGQTKEALEALEFGLKINPRPEVYEVLARAHDAAGDPRTAVAVLHEALLMAPGARGLGSLAAALYRRTDPAGCAVVSVGSATALNLNCELVKSDICGAGRKAVERFAPTGFTAEAAMAWQRAQARGCHAQ